MEKLQVASENISVNDIKKEWKQLWLTRISDKVRAEGVANEAFPLCFVEQGTVIVATRDFKPPHLKDILKMNRIQDAERIVGPPPTVGGWRKFACTFLNKQKRNRRFILKEQRKDRVAGLQLKKGGRGWMHRN